MTNPIFPRFIRTRWDRKALGVVTFGDFGLAVSIGAVVVASVAWGQPPAALGAIGEEVDRQIEAAGVAALGAALDNATVVPGYCVTEDVRPFPQRTPKWDVKSESVAATEVVWQGGQE
ncbi:hypothetical protein LCM08_06250 [Salipiger pacificus]|nr:hypothetical protein [Alloyangia pacifica]